MKSTKESQTADKKLSIDRLQIKSDMGALNIGDITSALKYILYWLEKSKHESKFALPSVNLYPPLAMYH